MKASEDIRRKKAPFYLYGTAQGEKTWLAARDRLTSQIADHRATLVPERTRDYDDQQDDQRELGIEMRSLAHIEHVLRNFKVIEPATTADVVDIGVIVTYRQYDDEGNLREPVTIQVGEYGMDDIHAKPRIMSYDNHLLLQLLGAAEGESRTVKLTNGFEYEFEILNIRLPQTEPAVRRVA